MQGGGGGSNAVGQPGGNGKGRTGEPGLGIDDMEAGSGGADELPSAIDEGHSGGRETGPLSGGMVVQGGEFHPMEGLTFFDPPDADPVIRAHSAKVNRDEGALARAGASLDEQHAARRAVRQGSVEPDCKPRPLNQMLGVLKFFGPVEFLGHVRFDQDGLQAVAGVLGGEEEVFAEDGERRALRMWRMAGQREGRGVVQHSVGPEFSINSGQCAPGKHQGMHAMVGQGGVDFFQGGVSGHALEVACCGERRGGIHQEPGFH